MNFESITYKKKGGTVLEESKIITYTDPKSPTIDTAKYAKSSLDKVNANVLGVVLNKIPIENRGYYKYPSYQYYNSNINNDNKDKKIRITMTNNIKKIKKNIIQSKQIYTRIKKFNGKILTSISNIKLKITIKLMTKYIQNNITRECIKDINGM